MNGREASTKILYKRSSPGHMMDHMDGNKRRKEDNIEDASGNTSDVSDNTDNVLDNDEEVSTNGDEIVQQQTTFDSNRITKRSIGKAILQFCGHEGTKNDSNKANLRRLLQAVLSHVDNEHPDTWRNAEVKIYDDNFDVYSLRAGDGDALFLATFDGMNNPQVVRTSRKNIESNVSKRKDCTIM